MPPYIWHYRQLQSADALCSSMSKSHQTRSGFYFYPDLRRLSRSSTVFLPMWFKQEQYTQLYPLLEVSIPLPIGKGSFSQHICMVFPLSWLIETISYRVLAALQSLTSGVQTRGGSLWCFILVWGSGTYVPESHLPFYFYDK